jgi:hypothetical protein
LVSRNFKQSGPIPIPIQPAKSAMVGRLSEDFHKSFPCPLGYRCRRPRPPHLIKEVDGVDGDPLVHVLAGRQHYRLPVNSTIRRTMLKNNIIE